MHHIGKPDAKWRLAANAPRDEQRLHHIGYLIHDVSRLRLRYFDTVFKASGLTRIHWWTVGNIARLGIDGICQGELAKLIDVKKAMMGAMIDRLEGAGLVQRLSQKEDRRIKRIKLTDKGEAFSDDLFHKVKAMTPKFNKSISPRDLEITMRTLETMRANIRLALDEQCGRDAAE